MKIYYKKLIYALSDRTIRLFWYILFVFSIFIVFFCFCINDESVYEYVWRFSHFSSFWFVDVEFWVLLNYGNSDQKCVKYARSSYWIMHNKMCFNLKRKQTLEFKHFKLKRKCCMKIKTAQNIRWICDKVSNFENFIETVVLSEDNSWSFHIFIGLVCFFVCLLLCWAHRLA